MTLDLGVMRDFAREDLIRETILQVRKAMILLQKFIGCLQYESFFSPLAVEN